MQRELSGNPHVRFLKGHTLNTGKKLVIAQVCRRPRKEAEELIRLGIAEKYTGPFPPKKMKTNFFKPKE